MGEGIIDLGDKRLSEVMFPAERPGPYAQAVGNEVDNEIEFNPHQAFLFKNVGEAHKEIFILPKHVEDQLQAIHRKQAGFLECAIGRWLARGGPGAHVGELVSEVPVMMPGDEYVGRTTIRVKAGPYWPLGQAGAGPVVVEVPGVRIKVVE